jgi:predicted component of type VI protein secretion system
VDDSLRGFVVRVTRAGAPHGQPVRCTGEATVGRAPGCEVHLLDAEVSRRHARLRPAPGPALEVEDLGSRNGTFVGQAKVDAQPLLARNGDSIRIGPFTLLVQFEQALEERTTAAAQTLPMRTKLDHERRLVLLDGVPLDVHLVGHEYDLLSALESRSPSTVPTHVLGDLVWGAGQWDVYMLHNLIARVRRKLSAVITPGDRVIINVPGVGYRVD